MLAGQDNLLDPVFSLVRRYANDDSQYIRVIQEFISMCKGKRFRYGLLEIGLLL